MRKTLGIFGILAILAFSGCAQQCPECKCETDSGSTVCGAAAAESETAAAAKGDATPVAPGGETIALPKPVAVAATLTKALEDRRSIRAYAEDMISVQDLSNLLWSANGINRENGKRTAPSARNLQSVTIHVAFEQGAYLYDFKAHQLTKVTDADVRSVKEAPIELIFSSNLAVKEDTPENREFTALMRGIDSGAASENAALYCAAAGLATVIRMYHQPEPEKAAALKLTENDHMLFNMAVGFEKK